jgi:hypothetical protein
VRKLFAVLTLWAGVVSCHLDKLLNSEKPPPSQAPPARVAFASSLSSARAGEPISPPVQVTVQDSTGRVTLRDTLVILSLGANPGSDKLRGDTVAHSVNGVATFANLRLDKAASGYTLTAAAPELHPDTSAAFSVMPAPATQLLFTVQPSSAMQDSAIKPPVQVTAYDSLGNKATNFTGPIRVALGTDGSVSKDATLSAAPDPVAAVAGVATFNNLRINRSGVGYTLTAAFGSATPVATSAAFDITPGPPPPPPPPTHLGFTQQPQTTQAGATITPPVQVAALDAAEHVVQGFTGAIGLALGTNPGGGTLSGGGPVNAVNGVVTFPNLSINQAGNGYTLRATASTLTAATSSPFNVTAQPPTTGDLTVTTSTTGASPDPDGYTFAVDGGTPQPIGVSQTITVSALPTGSHTVVLSGIASNCTVSSGTSRTITVPAGGSVTASFSVSCPTQAPTTGDLTVTTSTTGASPDPDGYTFAVDGGSSQGIGINASVTVNGLTAGSHTVVLSGIAGNCTVSGGTSQTVTVTAGQTVTATFTVSCPTPPPPTGSLTVTTSTSGGTPDPDGYSFAVDGGSSQAIGVNASVTVNGLTAGSHTVVLSGLAAICSVSGGTSQTVTVTAGQTVTATFTVSCPTPPPPTGSLTVTTSTSGGTPDPDGYTFTVDGGTGQAIAINASVTVNGLTAGSHTVVLSSLAANCSVSGGTSQTVTVTAGQTVTATFTVSCPTPPPPTGSLTVTTSTSGPDQPSGYTVSVSGGGSQTIGASGSVTFTGLATGSHTITLGGVPSNCSVSGGTSQTVTVTAGGTATAGFTISCTALTGNVTVSTTTSGPDQPSGYTVSVGGAGSQTIGSSGSVTFTGVATGSHTVTLGGVPSNCSVSGGTSQTVTVTGGGTASAAFTISCTALAGSLTVTTATSGPDQPSGYTVAVSGGGSQSIGASGSVTFPGLSTGSHTVTLSGTPSNCSVSGGSSQTVTVTAGGTASAAFTISCTALPGSLTVTTSTTGVSLDLDGYTVTVDGTTSQPVSNNGTVTFNGLSPGSHSVALSGVAANCTVSGGTSQTVTVPAGGTTSASFSVICTALPGTLTVTTATSGPNQPSGYTVAVNGGGSQSIGPNATATFSALAAGSHTVTLSGIASNCSVSGSNPQTVTVPAGGTAQASFTISCTAPNVAPVVNAGPDENAVTGLLYSFTWSFSDGNHNGPWSYTIDWGDGSSSSGSVASEGSFSAGHTYVILLPRTFTITVTVTDASGAPGSDSKVVSVTLL